VTVGNQPFGIAFTPSGAFAYVANFVGSSVSVIDTATATVVATITSGNARTPAAVAITPDGAFAYTANFNSNNVSVIDTATNTIVALVPGLSGPGGIAITPNRAPRASCQDATVAAGPSCTASASVDNGSADPDGDSLTLGQAPPAPYALGATTVTLTATDSFGASSRCTATVTVIDNTPPTITCPADITAKGNIPDSPFASVDPGTPTVTDNCAGVTVVGTRSDGQPLGAPYPFGTTTITQTATDAGGNQAACQQTITVVPNAPATKDQCKDDGWRSFTNPTFQNQGDCVSFVDHLP
jgi:YVTN family beta-propeller protein